MKIKKLIEILKKIENKERKISVVLGNDDYNSFVFDEFEIHNCECKYTTLEIFCFDEFKL